MLLKEIEHIDLFADLTAKQFDVEVKGEIITIQDSQVGGRVSNKKLSLILSTGVGYRHLEVDGIDTLTGAGIY